jgi:Na+/H+ antiporter NhaB
MHAKINTNALTRTQHISTYFDQDLSCTKHRETIEKTSRKSIEDFWEFYYGKIMRMGVKSSTGGKMQQAGMAGNKQNTHNWAWVELEQVRSRTETGQNHG